jgi:hypothetical protein
MKLPEVEMGNYLYAERGYEGELVFDERTSPLVKDWIFLNDVLLEQNNNVFQIDSLLISPHKIHPIDVKNSTGDYCLKNDEWFSMSGKPIKNPLHQVKRHAVLLRGLLSEMGCKIPVEPYLVFVNPEFHLYQAPINKSIIFPNQLNRFISTMKNERSYVGQQQIDLGKRILSHHLEHNPHSRKPIYHYEQLRKGMYCPKCYRMYERLSKNLLKCKGCDETEHYENAVLRSTEEFQLLFPDKKITTSGIHEWCGGIVSKKSIQKYLAQNYTILTAGRSSYYIKGEH